MICCFDSSVWIEIFSNGPATEAYLQAAEAAETLIVPTIVIYEVRRHSLAHFGEDITNAAWSSLIDQEVVDLDPYLAAAAAREAHVKKLAMADAIIYATAQQRDAILWTQDAHFQGLPGVRYFSKK